MQFKTKLGLVDIPNEEVLAAADVIRGAPPYTRTIVVPPVDLSRPSQFDYDDHGRRWEGGRGWRNRDGTPA